MECYNGCGAPLVNGTCEYCGRNYADLHVSSFRDIIEANALLRFFGADVEEEEEEEIVAMGSKEEIIKADFGPSYEPGLMESSYYPLDFEDGQKTLGLLTGTLLIFGALSGFVSPGAALPLLAAGLVTALIGGIRQWRHKETE